jgi:hypothetical protein
MVSLRRVLIALAASVAVMLPTAASGQAAWHAESVSMHVPALSAAASSGPDGAPDGGGKWPRPHDGP